MKIYYKIKNCKLEKLITKKFLGFYFQVIFFKKTCNVQSALLFKNCLVNF